MGYAGSRRQSCAQRDLESNYSLQGSVFGPSSMVTSAVRDSPRVYQRHTAPLYINDDSQSTLEQRNAIDKTESSDSLVKKVILNSSTKKFRDKLRSIASTDDYRKICTGGSDRASPSSSFLRESRSLDPFPSEVRRRLESINRAKPRTMAMTQRGSHSMDAGVATISNESIDTEPRSPTFTTVPEDTDGGGHHTAYKYLNNNCNGSIGGGGGANNEESQHCPLLTRQTSLVTPAGQDGDDGLSTHKRWYSLENVVGGGNCGGGGGGGHTPLDDDSCSKKSTTRNSIKSWIVGIFHGNGFKTSDSSLRKVGVVPVGVGTGVTGFGELQSTPEKESMV